MAKLNINSISILEFFDLQGISATDKTVLVRKYTLEDKKSYDNWYSEISEDFQLSEKKKFKTTKETNKNK